MDMISPNPTCTLSNAVVKAELDSPHLCLDHLSGGRLMTHTWSTKLVSQHQHPHHPPTHLIAQKALMLPLVHLDRSVENTLFSLFHSCALFLKGVVSCYCCSGNIFSFDFFIRAYMFYKNVNVN